VQHLREKSESSRAAWLTYLGFETGKRIGELEIGLRIVQWEEALCLELGNKDGLQCSYGQPGPDPESPGRLEEAMALQRPSLMRLPKRLEPPKECVQYVRYSFSGAEEFSKTGFSPNERSSCSRVGHTLSCSQRFLKYSIFWR